MESPAIASQISNETMFGQEQLLIPGIDILVVIDERWELQRFKQGLEASRSRHHNRPGGLG